jgi:molecular chaperone GrpE (heat shock protein)
VRLLDHVFALHTAAERSGQPQLAGQITSFQNACREAVRKVGITPFAPAPGETFDGKRHQTAGGTQPTEPALIAETLATGYTFQGRQIRAALVRLASPAAPAAPSETTGTASQQVRLPLEPASN